MLRIVAFVVLGMLAAVPGSAQVDRCTRYRVLIDAVVAGTQGAAVNLLNVGAAPRCFVMFVADVDRADRAAFKEFVRLFESSRSDKQAGASAAGSGTTTVVSQGPAAKVLSVAAEYGALTQSVNGRVVTVRGNLAGLPSALVRHDIFPYCVGSDADQGYCVDRSLLGVLRKFSFGVSFDPSRAQTLTVTDGATAAAPAASGPVTFSGSSKEISAVTFRAEIINHRDASSPGFISKWRAKAGTALNGAADDLLQAGGFVEAVMELPGFESWFAKSLVAVQAAGRDRTQVVDAFTAALNELAAEVRKMPGYEAGIADARAAYSRFFLAQDDLVEALATTNVLAFEYTQNRPALQAATSNYRAILDYPLSTQTRVVANAALTYYDSVPANQSVVTRFRDAQAGVQLDQGLGQASIVGPAVFSLAGYFQYQHSPAVLKVDPASPITGIAFTGLPVGAKEVFAKTGSIWLGQAKLSLTPSGSSVTVPLAVTWSNRTELIDKATWSGQVGLSYNVDALFAALTSR